MRAALLLLALSTPCFADDAKSLFARAEAICAKQGVEVVYVEADPYLFAMKYIPSLDRIEINVNALNWRHPDWSRREGFQDRVYSSDSPDHLIRHEIGHRMTSMHLGAGGLKRLSKTPIPLSPERVTETVSSQACKSAAEFVAETYAALWSGRKIPGDVYDAYVAMWRLP